MATRRPDERLVDDEVADPGSVGHLAEPGGPGALGRPHAARPRAVAEDRVDDAGLDGEPGHLGDEEGQEGVGERAPEQLDDAVVAQRAEHR